MSDRKICPECRINWMGPNDTECSGCRYKSTYQYTLSLDQEDRDWSFAHCEECGSSLDDQGRCRNTSCGNSPFQGIDWQ